MQVSFLFNGKQVSADLSQPIDISIPLRAGRENVKAFYAEDVEMEPMKAENFVGDVAQGGSCNVNEIFFSPHCNGTHTECVGHISKEKESLNQTLKEFFFIAQLITITPDKVNGDEIISRESLEKKWNKENNAPALIIRTTPNAAGKLTKDYSGTNPAYLHPDAAQWMAENKIEHLLIDLPSVDKESDDGRLLAHHAYWQYPESTRIKATITELIYIPDSVPDGIYLLNLQIASFENDASPSKPVLYRLF